MTDFEIRLSTLCYLKGIAQETAFRVVELQKKYNSWNLEDYMYNPPSKTVVRKVRRIVEEMEAV